MADEGQEKEKLQRKKGANLMKNLFKKIGALLVAAIMVLSMCTAVFADEQANTSRGYSFSYSKRISSGRSNYGGNL